jgi:hypothetical protein
MSKGNTSLLKGSDPLASSGTSVQFITFRQSQMNPTRHPEFKVVSGARQSQLPQTTTLLSILQTPVGDARLCYKTNKEC